MFEFRWLRGLVSRTVSQVATAIDPWDGSDNAYVSLFKRNITTIAADLSQMSEENRRLKVRYNKESHHAEMYNHGGVMFEIAVHGSECSPSCAIVFSRLTLPDPLRSLFVERLGPLSVTFEPAA